MTLRVLGAAMVLTTMTASLARADEIPENVITAADEAGVSPIDLAGAVNTTGLEPRVYECLVDGLLCPSLAHGYQARVRLTYYVEAGRTASGGSTYAGSTACSSNFRFGTRFRLPDGEVVTCNDRGMLGASGWLDIWRNKAVVDRYGSWATVEVLP